MLVKGGTGDMRRHKKLPSSKDFLTSLSYIIIIELVDSTHSGPITYKKYARSKQKVIFMCYTKD